MKQARLLDMAHNAIVVQDCQQTILYWNQGAERLYGWSRAEATGANVSELLKTVWPKSLADVRTVLLRKGHWHGEVVNTRKDGGRIERTVAA